MSPSSALKFLLIIVFAVCLTRTSAAAQCGPPVWHGTARPKQDLTACDGDLNTCFVVIAPQAKLSAGTGADLPWYDRGSGVFPPYGNDQHPMLVWQLNDDCGCAAGPVAWAANGAPGHPQLACTDLSGLALNDAPNLLGRREQVDPFTGVWNPLGDDFSEFDAASDRRLAVRESDL